MELSTEQQREYIERWAPDVRKKWNGSGSALLAVTQLHELNMDVHAKRITNAMYGNIYPGYEQYAPISSEGVDNE